jgi:putative molybdenum carrier protein
MIVGRIISGGQTGADLGALEAARQMGVPTGGTAPKGYRTETGPQPALLRAYGLVENESVAYARRTEANVAAADATLALGAHLDRGSALTVTICRRLGRPHRLVPDLSDDAAAATAAWLIEEHRRVGRPLTLNVAGPRESREPGIETRAEDFVSRLLSQLEARVSP